MNNPYLGSLDVIWRNPKLVVINLQKLKEVAGKMSEENLPIPQWRMEGVFEKKERLAIKQIFYSCCINFAFTNFDPPFEKFSIEYPKGKILRGSTAMIACFLRAREEGIPIYNSGFLTGLTAEDMRIIFRGKTPLPLLEERMENLRQAARIVSLVYNGDPLYIFNDTGMMAFSNGIMRNKGIVERLVEDFALVFYDGSEHFKSKSLLQFHKRAQLFAMMYQGRALSSNGRLKPIVDHCDLGPPADYAVPVALRHLGILEYCPRLEEAVIQRKLIAPHSPEEWEIRAQTVNAVLQLVIAVNSLRTEGNKVSVLEIDNKLWWLGRECSDPHHLTITTAY